MTDTLSAAVALAFNGERKREAEVSNRPQWWAHFEGREHEAPESEIDVRGLGSFLDDAARMYGREKAIIFQNYSITYNQLKAQAEAMAAALCLRGVQRGDRVAIMLPNIPQTIIAFWGVIKAGAVAVMTNPLYMEKELTHHFEDADVKILITIDLLWGKIDPLLGRLKLDSIFVTRIADGLAFPLNIIQPWKAKREGNLPEVPFDNSRIFPWSDLFRTKERFSSRIENPEDELALLQYTGGTTGLSKGAMLTHQNLSAQMRILQAIIGSREDTKNMVFLSIMPFFHVLGLAGNVLLPVLYGAATIPVPRYTPDDLLRTIHKYRPNFFVGAPSIYISLMRQKSIAKYDLTCIKYCISGSAPFPVESMKSFQNMTGANITEGYGLTEASPCLAANPIYGKQKAGSIGVPLPYTELRVVDVETGTIELGPNQVGELVAKGPQVMKGYFGRKQETDETLRDGWLFTGDIAYRDDEGFYFIVDRKKDMAIVGGYNVYPREIDEVLYEHPKVAEAVAVGVPHRSRGETLKAFVVPKPGETLTVAELAAHCREKLANYKVPKLFEFRTELPKTMVGKVLRRVLRDEEARKQKEDGYEDHSLTEIIQDSARHAKEQGEAMYKKAEELMEQARVQAETLRKNAEDLMEQAKEQAERLTKRAGELMDTTKDKAEEIKEKAGEIMDTTRDRAEELMDQAREQAGEISRAVSAKVDKIFPGKQEEEKKAEPAEKTENTAKTESSEKAESDNKGSNKEK